MLGKKTITELIMEEKSLKEGRINIIDTPVSSGKTYFALNVLPMWAGTPEKVLYLIDTTNGDLRLQQNLIAVSRQMYAFCDYNTKHVWGERETAEKMPVMTYAGFGAETLKNSGSFHWLTDFSFIVCDEMQNLVNYGQFKGDRSRVMAAEIALRMVAQEGKTKIIALSATPQKIREHFGELCYDVPFDRTDILRLETFAEVPYSGSAEDVLDTLLLQSPQKKTGILYTTEIDDMKRIIHYAREKGLRANGFWSIHAEKQMDGEQLALRKIVLERETIPEDIDLLVINASSETCIKIQGKKRAVDYMIVHNSNEEVRTQVRGRYHGDLPVLYYHDIAAANARRAQEKEIPERFLGTRLYAEEREELCALLSFQKPHAAKGEIYKWRTVSAILRENGYEVSPRRKDKRRNGQVYYVLTKKEPIWGSPQ